MNRWIRLKEVCSQAIMDSNAPRARTERARAGASSEQTCLLCSFLEFFFLLVWVRAFQEHAFWHGMVLSYFPQWKVQSMDEV